MANRLAESPARNDIELPPAVHWPTVFAMAGVGGGLAVVLLAIALIAAAQTPPPAQPTEAAAPVAVVLPPPSPRPLLTSRSTAPAETKPVDSGPPMWKPLVPHPARGGADRRRADRPPPGPPGRPGGRRRSADTADRDSL